jgi:small subunit ribosomal protein S17e
MGKGKTKKIKHLGKELIKRFPEQFSSNFNGNKLSVSKLTQGATTKIRNQIAGYITAMYVLKPTIVKVEQLIE